LIARAEGRRGANEQFDALYEPLDHIQPGLPPTLIHASGCEALLHDAQLAAQRLATAGVPVDVRVWPGQIHVFQLAAPMIPEATRSLRQIGRYIREATE
jgi:acetyl esterase/lipase